VQPELFWRDDPTGGEGRAAEGCGKVTFQAQASEPSDHPGMGEHQLSQVPDRTSPLIIAP